MRYLCVGVRKCLRVLCVADLSPQPQPVGICMPPPLTLSNLRRVGGSRRCSLYQLLTGDRHRYPPPSPPLILLW